MCTLKLVKKIIDKQKNSERFGCADTPFLPPSLNVIYHSSIL